MIIVEYRLEKDEIDILDLKRFLDKKLGKENYKYSISSFRRDGGYFPFIDEIIIIDIQKFEIVSLKNARMEKLCKIKENFK
jgi:hypothetical protein